MFSPPPSFSESLSDWENGAIWSDAVAKAVEYPAHLVRGHSALRNWLEGHYKRIPAAEANRPGTAARLYLCVYSRPWVAWQSKI